MTVEEKNVCFNTINSLNNVGKFYTLYYGRLIEDDKSYFLDRGCVPYIHYDGFSMIQITRVSPKNNIDIFDEAISSLNNVGDTMALYYVDISENDKLYFEEKGCTVLNGNSHLPADLIIRISPKGRVLLPHTKH